MGLRTYIRIFHLIGLGALVTLPFAAPAAFMGAFLLFGPRDPRKFSKRFVMLRGMVIGASALALFVLVMTEDLVVLGFIFAYALGAPAALGAGTVGGLVFWWIAVVQTKDAVGDPPIAA